MRGVEELPLKYIAMLIMAALIVGAVIYSTNILASTSIQGTASINGSLHALLNESLSRILSTPTTAP